MGFFDKIKSGLSKTRDALESTLGSVFSGFSEIDEDFYEELEECLILADLGVETAVISCGKDNTYGHPSSEVCENLTAVGAKTYRTDEQGSVIVTVKANGAYEVKTLGKN